MIISASKRTDIPFFYGEQFYNDLKSGLIEYQNPYNKNIYSIDVSEIDKIVFWSKYPKPFIFFLKRIIKEYNFDIIFHITITGYEKDIEPFNKKGVLKSFIDISNLLGKDKVIWRYDPIFFNEKYNMDFHKKMFVKINEMICGYTEKCVISFLDVYSFLKDRLSPLGIFAPTKEQKIEIAEFMLKNSNLSVETCSEDIDFLKHTACIEGDSVHGYREHCGCAKHIDIGIYNTCGFKCVYCYATK